VWDLACPAIDTQVMKKASPQQVPHHMWDIFLGGILGFRFYVSFKGQNTTFWNYQVKICMKNMFSSDLPLFPPPHTMTLPSL
jgi:hypothetical protein